MDNLNTFPVMYVWEGIGLPFIKRVTYNYGYISKSYPER